MSESNSPLAPGKSPSSSLSIASVRACWASQICMSSLARRRSLAKPCRFRGAVSSTLGNAHEALVAARLQFVHLDLSRALQALFEHRLRALQVPAIEEHHSLELTPGPFIEQDEELCLPIQRVERHG